LKRAPRFASGMMLSLSQMRRRSNNRGTPLTLRVVDGSDANNTTPHRSISVEIVNGRWRIAGGRNNYLKRTMQ
jgi:hypothetical protein